MKFTEWLAVNGYDAAALEAPETAKQKKHLEAAWKAETQPPPIPPPVASFAPTQPTSVGDKLSIFEAEAERKNYINERAATLGKMYADRGGYGDQEKLQQLREVRDAALSDQKMDARGFDLAMLRLERMLPPMAMPGSESKPTQDVLEAAVCMAGGMADARLAKHFNERTLDAASKQFGRGLGLQDVVMACAQANGYRARGGFKSDMYGVFRAACEPRSGHGGYEMYSSGGGAVPSTYSFPNLFSNVANKFVAAGFYSVETAWNEVAARGSRTDFKASTSIAMSGSSTFDELPPTGEIKHGTLAETAYSNQVKTYAQMIGIDRQHLINDDLGALTAVSRLLGVTAARTINKKFWGVFLNNSAFFTSGNNNVSTGAGSALSDAGLQAADAKFRQQTEPSGSPLGVMPAILLVPSTLWTTAAKLLDSMGMVGSTTANTLLPDGNIWRGKYKLVTSAYMEDTTLTGFSTAAWYLLANPGEMPVVEIAFLNGKAEPTVEQAEMDFNRLGVVSRAWIDMGTALQEFRGGVRSAGS